MILVGRKNTLESRSLLVKSFQPKGFLNWGHLPWFFFSGLFGRKASNLLMGFCPTTAQEKCKSKIHRSCWVKVPLWMFWHLTTFEKNSKLVDLQPCESIIQVDTKAFSQGLWSSAQPGGSGQSWCPGDSFLGTANGSVWRLRTSQNHLLTIV